MLWGTRFFLKSIESSFGQHWPSLEICWVKEITVVGEGFIMIVIQSGCVATFAMSLDSMIGWDRIGRGRPMRGVFHRTSGH